MKKFLIIEDNIDDIELFKMAHKEYNDNVNLYVAECYNIASPLLNSHVFDLIVLDINLPRKNGLEILKEIRSNSINTLTPVCIFTSSSLDDDIEKAYKNGCNAYIEKPFYYKNFINLVKNIFNFWLNNLKK